MAYNLCNIFLSIKIEITWEGSEEWSPHLYFLGIIQNPPLKIPENAPVRLQPKHCTKNLLNFCIPN